MLRMKQRMPITRITWLLKVHFSLSLTPPPLSQGKFIDFKKDSDKYPDESLRKNVEKKLYYKKICWVSNKLL